MKPRQTRPLDADRVAKAREYIALHCCENIGLKHVAEHVGLTAFHFHRAFAIAAGETPKQLITAHQMAAAKKMITAGVQFAVIARDCGFAHQSHFSSRFKQITGKSPLQFRREMEKSQ